MATPLPDLPVRDALDGLCDALAAGNRAVLEAPPGAGKTTLVPLALRGAGWLRGQRILVLEPRRLAARAAARRMAQLLGEEVGGTVGYRVRLESRVGPRTQVELITEGVLPRMLQRDPTLEGTGLVVFDEVHERSLDLDLGLALCLQLQEELREDLRLLAMSATLDGERMSALFGDAPVLRSEGRQYPVQQHFLERPPREDPLRACDVLVARQVRRALDEHADGDVLAFLPGAAEIRRTAERLEGLASVDICPLYGALPPAEQDRALRRAPAGRRKVVLATDIAESSLTVDGVAIVVDSGWHRTPRFSPRHGMARLATERIARDSADQRTGRAGRQGEGFAYRLWTRAEDAQLAPARTPEILAADLAPLALELAAWGVDDPAALRWLDPPPAAALEQGRALLRELGALDDEGAITAHGRELLRLPLHPRLGHLVVRGRELGLGGVAVEVAALLGERDPLRGNAARDPDLRLRLDALRGRGRAAREASRGALSRLRAAADQVARLARVERGGGEVEACGLLVALAFPDRVGENKGSGRFRLSGGLPVELRGRHPHLEEEPFLAVAELDARPGGAVWLAAPVEPDELRRALPEAIRSEREVAYDPARDEVVAEERERLGALVLARRPIAEPSRGELDGALLDAVRQRGLDSLPWDDGARSLRQRVAFLHEQRGEPWPAWDDASLLDALEDWLGPFLGDARRVRDLGRLDLRTILLSRLGWERQRELDELAPERLELPSGSHIRVDYTDPAAPVLAVKLQELFGATDTPRVAGGQVPLTLHLLSPAGRPVQVTQDLAGFWERAYPEVRKELRGRYVKWEWPEDPLAAKPGRGVKRRG